MHLPGVSCPQPSPSQVPDEHSAPSKHAAPSAFLPCSTGGGVGGVGSTFWGAPGSLVAGGVLTGSGGRDDGGGFEAGHAPRTKSSKIVTRIRASYTRRRWARALACCSA